MPFISGSTRPITAFAAIAASMALPPRSRTWTPARAASGWLAATIPYLVAIFERPGTTVYAGAGRLWAHRPAVRTPASRAAIAARFFMVCPSPAPGNRPDCNAGMSC